MCAGPEIINSESEDRNRNRKRIIPLVYEMEMEMEMEKDTLELSKPCFSSLLELAADNDVEGLKKYVEVEGNRKAVDEMGLWYGRRVGSRGMILGDRTPLMVSAEYGSVEVMKAILSLLPPPPVGDLNRTCGPDKTTALHFAASGGSSRAVDVVKLLLLAGADPRLSDAKGRRPFHVISVSRMMLPQLKFSLEDLLYCNTSSSSSSSSSTTMMVMDSKPERRVEYHYYRVDPSSIPDINNGMFASDEFRMYSFKVRPCSRGYSHDWTECPFVHPGENARRRDPRKFHYSCVPCPEFRSKGSCRRGDLCEYAHGVFECWLHPAQYRSRLCKDGSSCARRVCFFAHTLEQLRPLFLSSSTGSAPLPASPHNSAMDHMATANAMSPNPNSPSFPPPISPPHSSPAWQWQWQWQWQWPQQDINIPSLLLPGRSSCLQANSLLQQASRLQDWELEQHHILDDISMFSRPQFNSPPPPAAANHLFARPKALTPSKSNHDDPPIFSAEALLPPQFSDPVAPSAISSNHFSPINNTKLLLSAKSIDHPLLQSRGMMMSSPRGGGGGGEPQSTLSSRVGMLSLDDKQPQLRSLSSRDLGSDAASQMVFPPAVSRWSSKWDSTHGKPDWSLNGDEPGPGPGPGPGRQLRRSYTVGRHTEEEPDVSWVHSLVKDSHPETKEQLGVGVGEGSYSSTQAETTSDHSDLSCSWVDQIAAQGRANRIEISWSH